MEKIENKTHNCALFLTKYALVRIIFVLMSHLVLMNLSLFYLKKIAPKWGPTEDRFGCRISIKMV